MYRVNTPATVGHFDTDPRLYQLFILSSTDKISEILRIFVFHMPNLKINMLEYTLGNMGVA